MNSQRIHTSDSKTIDLDRTYGVEKPNGKPFGIWYSIDRDWHDWCEGANFDGIKKFDYELDVDMYRIFKVTCLEDLRKMPTKQLFSCSELIGIDWAKFKTQYKGFELINQNKMKFSPGLDFTSKSNEALILFVYGLDCDGGCIWDLSAIKGVKRVSEYK